MKNLNTLLIFALFLTFGAFSTVQAEEFNISLHYGSTQKAEVLKLQNFLYNLGYLKVTPTGKYFGVTQKAVADFQRAEGVSPTTGIFGPLTRAAATGKSIGVSVQVNAPAATIQMQAVLNTNNAGTAILSNAKVINWQTTNYPANIGVNINLLRKISDNPNQFVVVKNLYNDTLNDGQETWIPENGERTTDLYIEVVCLTTFNFKNGCKSSNPIKIR